MKRQRRDRTKIRACWPVFWRECYLCEADFRLEQGWKFTTGPYYGGMGVTLHACRGCAPKIEDVAQSRGYLDASLLKTAPDPKAEGSTRDGKQC